MLCQLKAGSDSEHSRLPSEPFFSAQWHREEAPFFICIEILSLIRSHAASSSFSLCWRARVGARAIRL